MPDLHPTEDGYQAAFDRQGAETLRIYPGQTGGTPSALALVTFASFCNPGRPAPSFAFLNSTLRARRLEALDCDLFYLLAHRNDWYQSGIRGFEARDLRGAAAQLRQLLTDRGHARTVFMGNSMGGYAALACGALCGADGVVAFAPQTRFDAAFCGGIGETRWQAEFGAMRAAGPVDDMAVTALWPRDRAGPQTLLHVGARAACDLAYARAVADLSGVRVLEDAGSGHDIALDFRRDGRLHDILVHAARGGIGAA